MYEHIKDATETCKPIAQTVCAILLWSSGNGKHRFCVWRRSSQVQPTRKSATMTPKWLMLCRWSGRGHGKHHGKPAGDRYNKCKHTWGHYLYIYTFYSWPLAVTQLLFICLALIAMVTATLCTTVAMETLFPQCKIKSQLVKMINQSTHFRWEKGVATLPWPTAPVRIQSANGAYKRDGQ